jgi:calcineurin-like phosphoesterase family protein
MSEKTKNKRKVFLTSDTHFFHENIIKYCKRPFHDVTEMNRFMTNRWNEVVSKNDLVIHLGDVSAGVKENKEKLKKLLKSLNGTKILIRGNHDHYPDKWYIDAGFSAVYTYLEIGKYFLCHYGLETNQYTTESERKLMDIFEKSKCSVVVHGHTHTRNIPGKINVSVDNTDFIPFDIEDL